MKAIHSTLLSAIQSLKPVPGTLLDIGCKDGRFTRVIAAALPHTAISAIDPCVSRKFITMPNVAFTKASAEHLPFDNETFDAVVIALSLHHWNEKETGIKEAYRVLKKGGRLIIGDPLLEGWLSNQFWGWLMQTIDRGSFANAKNLHRYLDEAGFNSVSITLVPNMIKALYLITAAK